MPTIDNGKHKRGLTYIASDLSSANLFAFVDSSFPNNDDMTSQIDFCVVIANKSFNGNYFDIRGNLIHWSSKKCKRSSRSILAAEIYGMVKGVDIWIAINTSIDKIINILGLKGLDIIFATYSESLYDCLIKLGDTSEKKLEIDVITLSKSYEGRELHFIVTG